MAKLPIGVQSFQKIRENDFYYVDKTKYALELINSGAYYFLSRPRRFGKSLLADTIKELFEGNEPLFRGLYIHTRWDWTVHYPVVAIDFGQGVLRNRAELDEKIREMLSDSEQRLGVRCSHASISGRFAELIRLAHEKHRQRVVVLIDEYDKPILDNIEKPETAREMREGLKNFYSVIKGADEHIRFVFLTGVSKFSQVSLFSGLNNLEDITLNAACSAICGYTDQEIDTVFAPELEGLDREAIRTWYNGYNWLGEGVYNPYDVLTLFRKRLFQAHWFKTATPTFLTKLLVERGFYLPKLARLEVNDYLLDAFDVDHIATEALLFQTGYLTIHKAEQSLDGMSYTLGFPNKEVEISLNQVLLPLYGLDASNTLENRKRLLQALRGNDFKAMELHLKSLYASLPHHWHTNNTIAAYEGFYGSVFYSHFAAMGVDVRPEDPTNLGRTDVTVIYNRQIYIFEFKPVEDQATGEAIRQIKEKRYSEKYRTQGLPIHLIGIEFSKKEKNIVGFSVEQDIFG